VPGQVVACRRSNAVFGWPIGLWYDALSEIDGQMKRPLVLPRDALGAAQVGSGCGG
jgi:hypothetical protein